MRQSVYRFGQCEVDTGRRSISLDGKVVDTQPKVFDLLLYLIENRERVVDKDELLERVWAGTVVSESSLTQAVRRARAITGDDGGRQRIIQTVQRRGYRFVADVEIVGDPEDRDSGAETAGSQPSAWPVGVFLLVLVATVVVIVRLLFLDSNPGSVGATRSAGSPFEGRSTHPRTASQYLESDPDWSPDGRSIVYVSSRNGNPDLWISGPDGQDRVLTTHDAEEVQPAWSPDGRHIAFVSSRDHGERLDRSVLFGYTLGGGIFVVPSFGGETRPVVDGGFNPDWSPDGERLVFDASFDGPRRIWVCRLERCEPERISHDASSVAVHGRPAWSPDGNWIAYERQEGSQSSSGSIHIAAADGRDSIRLTDASARNFSPAWIGSNALVFASDRGGAINLWKLDIDPDSGEAVGDPVQVTLGAGSDLDPAVSADGRLVYVTLRRLQNLWQVAVDPENWEVLGEPERVKDASWNDIAPAISPDMERVVFVSDRSGDLNIWSLDSSTGQLSELVDGDGQDLQPDLSPDGVHIVYFSNASGNNEIWIAPVDGGTPVMLTNDPADDTNPYWSPDGKSIAFMSDRRGTNEVWVMGRDGSDPRRISEVTVTGHTARWSPDGHWIIFTSDAGGGRDIYIAAADGSETRQLTAGESLEAHALWGPESNVFLYLDGHQQIYVQDIASGERALLLDLGERIDYLHLSRDGSLLLFTRENLAGDLYVIE